MLHHYIDLHNFDDDDQVSYICNDIHSWLWTALSLPYTTTCSHHDDDDGHFDNDHHDHDDNNNEDDVTMMLK